jgi:hypothetical protein
VNTTAIAKADTVRAVAPSDWGKAILEELLFLAAEQVSAGAPVGRSVQVTLTFALTPDPIDPEIEISVPGQVEGHISTRLPLRLPKD